MKDALRFFEAHHFFVITTHEGPDGDGLGAEVLLSRALVKKGKKVLILNADPTPDRFAFIDPERSISAFSPKIHLPLPEDTGIVILDSSDDLHLGTIADELLPHGAELFVIDHHERMRGTKIHGAIDPSASSTCEMVLSLALKLSGELDTIQATAAYAGIIYDTGSFIYPKTGISTFRWAVKLMQAGAVPHEIYQSLFESSNLGALLLQKRVLASLELHEKNRIALQTMLASDILAAAALYEDAEPLINIPLRSRQVEVSILLKENEEGKLRCSLRSKGKVNVSLIAQGFGGGGHKTAAGFKCHKGLAETKKEVLQQVIQALTSR